MPVPPDAVWDVLADPASYDYWVPGSKEIRDAEPGFPASGTRFHHTLGFGPLTLRDNTEVLEADPPRLLRLRAKGRPIGSANVTVELIPDRGGTTVRMTENPAGRLFGLALIPLLHAPTLLRNAESLMRLEELALRRSGA
jgi:carbon monoxide dehydrogenase subunit G